KSDGLVTFLVQKMRTISIAIQIGSLYRLQVRFLEFVACLECLLKDRVREKVAHLQAHQGLAPASGGRVYVCFQATERSVFKLKQHLSLDINSINERGHEVL